MRFCTGGERAHIFVAQWDPCYVFASTNSVYDANQGISSDTKDAYHAR